MIFNLKLYFNQQSKVVKVSESIHMEQKIVFSSSCRKIYSYIHVSLVYRKDNLHLCHRVPTWLIIHTFRGLKIFRAACLSNKFETLIPDGVYLASSELIAVFLPIFNPSVSS